MRLVPSKNENDQHKVGNKRENNDRQKKPVCWLLNVHLICIYTVTIKCIPVQSVDSIVAKAQHKDHLLFRDKTIEISEQLRKGAVNIHA